MRLYRWLCSSPFAALFLAPLLLLMLAASLGNLLWQALPRWHPQPRRPAQRLRRRRLAAVAATIFASPWALSGCGTPPLQAAASMQVPAGLLTPPHPPVLLPLRASLNDALANHAENAALCRIDRGNQQRLIDYLQSLR